LHDRLTSFCARAGFHPNIVQEATQWQTVVALVEAGMGVSLAPACVRKLRWEGVAYRALSNATTSVTACWEEHRLSPAAEQFLKMSRNKLA
jgi:DNA-binding transcriptional LysR family regulator